MSWRGLRHKGVEVLFPEEWNAVVDSLNDLYNTLFTGTGDAYFDELVANKATFNTRPVAEGRAVLLDGDPISIYDIFDYARDKIAEAVDATAAASYIKELRDKVVGIRVDAYGNVGIVVAEPLDEYARVKVAPPAEILDEFKPVSASGSVTAADNTAGLSVVLFKGGRPNVNMYYSAGGAAEIMFEVSLDGVTWRTVDVISLSAGGSGFKVYTGIAYPWVRVYSPTTAVGLEFELVASR
jgi:hypothetical protein